MADGRGGGAAGGWLSRERIVASAGYNRWRIPPAALAIHLCIGMACGFSVFWLPMTHLIVGAPACGGGFLSEMTDRACNWTPPSLTPIFATFIAVLGLSAAVFGGWVERVGPRRSGVIAALCWGGGLLIAALGVRLHLLWIVFLGAGLIGGVGQGLGYITPVSTLIRWFPDRRGMATGFAIMGYGGGALIGSPLAVWLMARLAHGGAPGVAGAFASLGLIYAVFMLGGALGFRLPPQSPGAAQGAGDDHLPANAAWRTPQFWLLWVVLFANVTAGIALLAMASPMLQEVFGARLLGLSAAASLTAAQKAALAASAAGLVGLISLFNSLGRLFWASVSDRLGRKATYAVFFILGALLYAALPVLGHLGLAFAFVAAVCIILSMYGGGFSTLPAYIADVFGDRFVGAIHGRVITAWSAAGVVGPALIAGLRQAQLDAGATKARVYDGTLYLMAGLMILGLICNLFVRPLVGRSSSHVEPVAADGPAGAAEGGAGSGLGLVGALAWFAVAAPFLIGLFIAVQKAAKLF